MKRLTIVLMLLLTNICSLYSQGEFVNGKAYYNKSYISNTSIRTSDETKDVRTAHLKELIEDATSKLEFVLSFNNFESSFQQLNVMDIDNESVSRAATIIGGGKGVYYSNRNDDISLHQKEAFGKKYLIESRFKEVQWELINESKMIDDILCYKAIAFKDIFTRNGPMKKKVIAWYALNIPINFGPIGYGNLPGLILELREGKSVYTCKKIDYFSDDIEIIKPKVGEQVSQAAFNLISKKAFENLMEMRKNKN